MFSLILAAGGNPLSHVTQKSDPSWTIHLPFLPDMPIFHITLMSNHIFMQIITALLLVIVVPWAVRRRAGTDEVGRLVPSGFGNAIEALCLGLRTQIFEPNLGKYTNIFAPYLWSLFFFIFVSNALGLVPLAEWSSLIGGHDATKLIGGTSTGNLGVTATLAVATLLLVVYNGLRYHGMNYVAHFFMGPSYIAWFIAILEIAGLAFKTLALCMRLFANMLAGHIILAMLLSFIPASAKALGSTGASAITVAVIAGCVLFYFLEILVAFLHAFIFTTLTAVFLGQAVNIHHDHDEEHGHEDAHGHTHAHAATAH